MTVLSGGVRTAMAAFRERTYRNAIAPSRNYLRYSTSAPPPASDKYVAAADRVLVDDSVDSDDTGVETAEPTLLRPRVVVYDGVCHLCHAGVKWVIEADKDKQIKFCCLQSKAAEPYLSVCELNREDVLRRFLFVEGPGLYHQGSAAALKVLSYLPLPYSALSSLMIIPTPLRDAIYDYVAKRRYDWFGKDDDCLVLKEIELLERFIDSEELFKRKAAKSYEKII
ncbi:hypothetical protein BUALT_Bualt17G0051700 [Buddleja alternifolia]|uniref:Thiol-disulfide oxidoreductase DCC n=1 Tax=Buddleja alternifolia TaxID=168488 RepID=A0AAV6WEP2_9LAMI|nr:hypothetical protein BUALT_Bualt17G0051700 [Buddleja alternifolia]